METAGLPVTSGLSVGDPFRSKICPFKDKCLAAEGQDCTTSRLVYKVNCKLCEQENTTKSQYFGTSGHNLHKRMGEHIACIRNNKVSSALAKHRMKDHPNSDPENPELIYETSVVAGNIVHNVTRFIKESLVIDKHKNDPNINLLNSHSEWGNIGVRRLTRS